MSSGSALERAFADSDRMVSAAKAAIGNPALALSPMPAGIPYNMGEVSLDRERLLHYKDWAYVCINAIAKRIAGQPMMASYGKRSPGQRGKSYKDDLLPLDAHPFLDAIHAPNALMTKWPLIFTTVASLELTGKSFWWFPLVNGAREIWPLPSDWIHPVDNIRTAYTIRPFNSGKSFTVPASEIAYFSLPDPANPFCSVSPLQSQAAAVEADEAIQTAQARSYQNGLFPSLAIIAGDVNDPTGNSAPPVMNTDQRNVILDALRKMFQGPGKNGSAIILDRLIKDVKKISNTPAEMDFMQSGEQIKSRIFQAYGVNPIVVGQTNDANRAQAVVAEQSFVENVINPLIELLSETLTRWVGPLFAGGKKLIVWIEPCRVKDHELNIQEFELGLKYGMISRNDYRTRLMGFPPVPGQDVFVMPLNCEVVPVGEMPSGGDDDTDDPPDPDVKKKR